MANSKALGPHGFIVAFFKQRWHFLHDEIHAIIQESRRNTTVLHSFNSTFLVVVPKEENVASPSKYQLITLYNVIYKIITKVKEN